MLPQWKRMNKKISRFKICAKKSDSLKPAGQRALNFCAVAGNTAVQIAFIHKNDIKSAENNEKMFSEMKYLAHLLKIL